MRLPFEQPDITPAAPQYGGGPMVQAPQAMDVSGPYDQMSRGIENLMATIDGGSKIYKTWKEADRTKQWNTAMEEASNYYDDSELTVARHFQNQQNANLGPDNAQTTIDNFLSRKIKNKNNQDYNLDTVENSIEDDSVRDRFKTWRRLRSQKFLSDNLGKMVGELFTRLTDSIDAKGSVVTDKMLRLYKEGKSEAEINAVFEKEFKGEVNSLDGIEALSPIQKKNANKETAKIWVNKKFNHDYNLYADDNPEKILKGLNEGKYSFKHDGETTSFDQTKYAGTIRGLMKRESYINKTLKLNAMKSLITRLSEARPALFLKRFTEKKGPKGKDFSIALQDTDLLKQKIQKDYGFEPSDIEVQQLQQVINAQIKGAKTAIKNASGNGVIEPDKWQSKLNEYYQYSYTSTVSPDTQGLVNPLQEYTLSDEQLDDVAEADEFLAQIEEINQDLGNMSQSEINDALMNLEQNASNNQFHKTIFSSFQGYLKGRSTDLDRGMDVAVSESNSPEALEDVSVPLDMDAAQARATALGVPFRPMPEHDRDRFLAQFDKQNLNKAYFRGLESQFTARYGPQYSKSAMDYFVRELEKDGKADVAALLQIQDGMSDSILNTAVEALATDDKDLLGIAKAEGVVRQWDQNRTTVLDGFKTPRNKGPLVRLIAKYARAGIGINAGPDETFSAITQAQNQLFAHWTTFNENGMTVSIPNKWFQKYIDVDEDASEDLIWGLEAMRYNIPLDQINLGIDGEQNMTEEAIDRFKISARAGDGTLREVWDFPVDGSDGLQLYIMGADGLTFMTPTWKSGINAGKPVIVPASKFTENWAIARRAYEFLDDYEPLFESPSEADYGKYTYMEDIDKMVYSKEPPVKGKSKWQGFLWQTWGSRGLLEQRTLKMLETEGRVQRFIRTKGKDPGKPSDGDILVAIDKLQNRYFGPGKRWKEWYKESFRSGKPVKSSRYGTVYDSSPDYWDYVLKLWGTPAGGN